MTSLISRANQEVRIEDVLRDLYGIDAAYGSEGVRTQCPVSYQHKDGGLSVNSKLYSSSNLLKCWSCGGTYRPVDLYMLHHQLENRTEASRQIMDEYGVRYTPPTLEERWNMIEEEPVVEAWDKVTLKGVILNHAHTIPNYMTRQFDDDVIHAVDRCIVLIDKLPERMEYATLDRFTQYMKNILDKVGDND